MSVAGMSDISSVGTGGLPKVTASHPPTAGGTITTSGSTTAVSKRKPIPGSMAHMEEKKIKEIVGASLAITHAFGSTPVAMDGLFSIAEASTDKDLLDKLVYRIGTKICVADTNNNSQKFFNTQREVTRQIHFAIDNTLKYISICESIRTLPEDQGHAQISVYSLVTFERVKQLTHPCSVEFAMSMFCNDQRQLVSLTEQPDSQVIVWTWQKEKIHKSFSSPVPFNRISSAPCTTLMLVSSGINHLKVWYLGSDSMFKSSQLVPISKENDYYIDHKWLASGTTEIVHKLIVLAGHDPNIANTLGPVALASYYQKQTVLIFEGNDSTATGNTIYAPITMDLKQTLSLKVDASKGIVANSIVATVKGFALVGGAGFIALFERTDDRREGYVELRRFFVGEQSFITGSLSSSEENLFVLAKNNRLLQVPIESINNTTSVVDGAANDSHIVPSSQVADKSLQGAVDISAGFHLEPILSADIAKERSLLVTISADQTARIWNFETLKCELIHYFRNDEPLAVSFHPSGFQLLVSFKDRVRLYNLLVDKLKPYKEVILKNAKELKFSNGGQYWAAASSIHIMIYATSTCQQLVQYSAHTMTVKKLTWSIGDLVVFSAGVDGNVYGWPLSKVGRIDVIVANARSSAILDIVVDCPNLVFPKEEQQEDVVNSDEPVVVNYVNEYLKNKYGLIISSMDGALKIPEWIWDVNDKEITGEPQRIAGSATIAITSLHLTNDRRLLYCGCSNGAVRVYAWPPVTNSVDGVFLESRVHSSPIILIKESPSGSSVCSVGEDGSIFVHSVIKAAVGLDNAETEYDLIDSTSLFNSDVLMMSIEDVDEHVQTLVNLRKVLEETNAKHSFSSSQKELAHGEMMKKMIDMQEITLANEKAKFEKHKTDLEKRIKDLLYNSEIKELDHAKVKAEIENRYEHKLADQLDRYDRAGEEMQLLKQKCEGLLNLQKQSFATQLSDSHTDARLREKKLRTENKRITEDRVADESSFKEILDQQETEYEDELRQLIGAAENELINERETITKLRTLVQTKNTKVDQLKKKLIELSMASKARLTLLNNEVDEKKKMQDTIEHYRLNLKEREDALAEKEKIILELRSKTRTLENFRFVLDHRLQQLSAERGPITSHIENLERHISTIYEELVEEFDLKKNTGKVIQQKDYKMSTLTQDLHKYRNEAMKSEQYIASFKREISNILTSAIVGKELEEAVRNVYKKFVRGEQNVGVGGVRASEKALEKVNELLKPDDNLLGSLKKNEDAGQPLTAALKREVDDALVDTAKEAERQRGFMEKTFYVAKNRLLHTKKEAFVTTRRRLQENSDLLTECNGMRREINDLTASLELANRQNSDHIISIKKLKGIISSATLNSSVGGLGEALKQVHLEQFGHKSVASDSVQITSNILPQTTTGDKLYYTEADKETMNWNVHNSLTKNNSASAAIGMNNPRMEPNRASESNLNPIHGTQLTNPVNNKKPQHSSSTKSLKPALKMNLTDRTIDKLTSEVDNLKIQLDDAHKEKEMQRLELGRVRSMMKKMAIDRNLSFTTVNESAFNNLNNTHNSLTLGRDLIDVDHSITNADIHGVPSEAEILELNLVPVKQSTESRKQSRVSCRYIPEGGRISRTSSPNMANSRPSTANLDPFPEKPTQHNIPTASDKAGNRLHTDKSVDLSVV